MGKSLIGQSVKKNHTAFALTLLAMASGAACARNTSDTSRPSVLAAASQSAQPTQPAQPCEPLETRPPNAPEQKPAFAGQTRALGVKSDVAFEVTVLAGGLDKPWAVEPLPDGDFLITEKPGRLRIISAKGEVGQPIGGLLPVGSGGLSAASGPQLILLCRKTIDIPAS